MCQHHCHNIAWGYDYPLQTYFFQMFTDNAEEELVCDLPQFGQSLSHGELLDLLDRHNVLLTEQQRTAYVLDMPCCPRGGNKTPQMEAFLASMLEAMK